MKKAFNIAANVCAIVLMSVICIGALILISTISNIGGDIDGAYVGANLVIYVFILLFGIAAIIVSAFALAKGNHEERGASRALKITVIVLVGILALLAFIGGSVVYGILCLIPIGLEITSICVPSKPKTDNTKPESSATPQTTDEKIAELKKLKSLHVISDEQYENAITEIVKDLKD